MVKFFQDQYRRTWKRSTHVTWIFQHQLAYYSNENAIWSIYSQPIYIDIKYICRTWFCYIILIKRGGHLPVVKLLKGFDTWISSQSRVLLVKNGDVKPICGPLFYCNGLNFVIQKYFYNEKQMGGKIKSSLIILHDNYMVNHLNF